MINNPFTLPPKFNPISTVSPRAVQCTQHMRAGTVPLNKPPTNLNSKPGKKPNPLT